MMLKSGQRYTVTVSHRSLYQDILICILDEKKTLFAYI